MKRLLLPLLTALALPTAINADVAPYHLIIRYGAYTSSTIPMKTLEVCEAALEKGLERNNWAYRKKTHGAYVITGICLKSE